MNLNAPLNYWNANCIITFFSSLKNATSILCSLFRTLLWLLKLFSVLQIRIIYVCVMYGQYFVLRNIIYLLLFKWIKFKTSLVILQFSFIRFSGYSIQRDIIYYVISPNPQERGRGDKERQRGRGDKERETVLWINAYCVTSFVVMQHHSSMYIRINLCESDMTTNFLRLVRLLYSCFICRWLVLDSSLLLSFLLGHLLACKFHFQLLTFFLHVGF